MRIMQINPIAGHSSTGRAVSELDAYWTSRGHTDEVVCFSGYNVSNMYAIGSAVDRNLHALLSRLTGYEASFSSGTTRKLIAHIAQTQPDVVKINIVHSNYLNYFMLMEYLGKQNIPTVLVLNDCWHFTGKCVHYTQNGCHRWREGCGHCPHLENGLPTWFFDRTAQMLEKKRCAANAVPRLAVVGVSDWITNEAKLSVLNSAKIIRRIYNWVDLKQFHPQQDSLQRRISYGLENKSVLLGVASDWSSGKGLKDFLRLSEMLAENEVLVLVGNMPKGQALPNNIINIAQTRDMTELACLYSMADVFVSLSRGESFGKVSAEAMACGTPVVCYDATACPELIGKGCGTSVPVGDFKQAAAAIHSILRQGKGAYQAHCIQHASDNFCMEKSAEEYLQLFQELLA